MLSFQSSKITPIPEIKQAVAEGIKAVEMSFDYLNPSGMDELRERISTLLPHWPGEVLITNSATEATYLALSQIRGGVLALHSPCYFGVLRQARDLDIKVIEWETVEELLLIKDCDAILLTSNFTPPAGKSFSEADKTAIAEYANSQTAIVIEDNAYEFLPFHENPLTSIKTVQAIKVSSFSKLLSPSLRVGFIVAEGDLFKKVRSAKITMNLSSAELSQIVIHHVLKHDGIITLWRKELHERAQLLIEEISTQFNIKVEMPEGGSFIKLPLATVCNIPQMIHSAKQNGLLIDDNFHQYLNQQNQSYFRLHLGAIKKENISAAIRILKPLKELKDCLSV